MFHDHLKGLLKCAFETSKLTGSRKEFYCFAKSVHVTS